MSSGDFNENRPILHAILNDPSLQAILGDEAGTLLNTNNNLHHYQPGTIPAANNNANSSGTNADLFHLTSDGNDDNQMMMNDAAGDTSYEQLAYEQNEATLDEISLRHRCSDLEAENTRLRTLLQQQSASTTELTRKLNLRDVVVDGLRKSVIQSQSQNARSLGQPASLGFDVVEALEEELSTAVAAQVRLREASEGMLKTKLERQERGLRRIIAAKEREIIQLHLQFRQTLIQLRSQHSGDIQNVFEENTKLKRMAAEAEQNALIAAEVQFNTRLRAEQMRIESECDQRVSAKLVEMKYLRECLDTQEAAAKKLEDTIAELNRKIESKERILHHVLDVEMPYELNKIKKQLDEYISKDSAKGQVDLANALVEIEELKTEIETNSESVKKALRERDDATHSNSNLKNDNASKDTQIRDLHSRLSLQQQTINALERDQEQAAMEVHMLRRMQVQQEDQNNNTMNASMLGNTMGGSPSSTSSSLEAELRRQVSLFQDENSMLKNDMTKALEQVNKYREDVKSAASSRGVLQDRCAELEQLLQDQIDQSQEALNKAEKKFRKELDKNSGGGGGAMAGVGSNNNINTSGRRGTRVNILLPDGTNSSDNNSTSGGLSGRTGSMRKNNNNLTSGGSFVKKNTSGGSNNNNNKDHNSGSRRNSDSSLATPQSTSINTAKSLDSSTNPSRPDSAMSSNTQPSLEQQQQQNKNQGDSSHGNKNNNGENNNNNDNKSEDPFDQFGARWEQSAANFNNSNKDGVEYSPRKDPSSFVEIRHVGIQCARLLPPPSSPSSASNTHLRPTSASLSGRPGSGLGDRGTLNQTPVQYGQQQAMSTTPNDNNNNNSNSPSKPNPVSSTSREVSFVDQNNAGGANSNNNNRNTNNSNNNRPTSAGTTRPLSSLGVTRVDSMNAGNNSSFTSNNKDGFPTLVPSQPPSAVTQTLNPEDSQQYRNNNQQQQQDNENNSNNQDYIDGEKIQNNSNNNQRPSSGGDSRSTSSVNNNNNTGKDDNIININNNHNTNNNNNNLMGEIEILPDEELHQYGVHSTVDDRLINARLRIELCQIKFEVQHLAPPRFMAQAKAMITNSWENVEEFEAPLLDELMDQNDKFEDELAKRREFHALVFPGNHRCARFPYRADPSADSTEDIDKTQLSLFGDDGVTKRSKNDGGVKDFSDEQNHQPFEIDSRYDIDRGDLDALRRQFIASAMALSATPGGMEILRVPISSVILRPHSASKRIIDTSSSARKNNESLRFAPNTTVGAGFRIHSAPSSPPRSSSARPLSAVNMNTHNNNNNSCVRATWKAPDGFLNVDSVQIPSVDHFTTRPQVLQPRPPSGASNNLHWKEAASSHTGQSSGRSNNNNNQHQAPRRVPINVNLDVTAVLADKTFANEQLQLKESEDSAVKFSKKKREFSNVMKQRMDPGYQSGTEYANNTNASNSARPTSARTASLTLGGRNGRTIQ